MTQRLTRLMDEEVVIARMQTTKGDRMAMSTVTHAMANKQRSGTRNTQEVEGVFAKEYKFYMDTRIDIQEGDRLRDEGDVVYKVKSGGVTSRSQGSISYKEVIADRTEE